MPFAIKTFGYADERTPRIPDDPLLEQCIQRTYKYPSPYPKTITPIINYTTNRSVSSGKEKVISSWSDVDHALHKIKYTAEESIQILSGSVIAAQKIYLKAPVIKILDNPDWAIRTTLIAKRKLSIEADELIVCGADIFKGGEFYLKKETLISLENIHPNTKWLDDFMNSHKA